MSKKSMSLETRVRQEVDSWNPQILNMQDRPVSYADLAKPLLYGIGIGVTEKVLSAIGSPNKTMFGKEILEQTYHAASAQFSRAYLLVNLARNDYSPAEAGKAAKLNDDPEFARQMFHRLFKQFCGVTPRKMKEHPELTAEALQYIEGYNPTSNEKLTQIAEEETVSYANKLFPSLLRSLLLARRSFIGRKLTDIAIEYQPRHNPKDDVFDTPYFTAVSEFERWYLQMQLEASDGSGTLAAKKSGLNHGAFRQMISRKGMKTADYK